MWLAVGWSMVWGAGAQTAPSSVPIELEGRVQLDYSRSNIRAEPEPTQFEIRRARVAATLQPTPFLTGKVDVSLHALELADAYADLESPAVQVRIGMQKVPFSYAYLESSRFIPFAERTMATDIQQLQRTVGVVARSTKGPVNWWLGGGEATPFQQETTGMEAFGRIGVELTAHIQAAVGATAGSWAGFAPTFQTASGYEWAGIEPVDEFVGRAQGELLANAAPVRVDVESNALVADDALTVVGASASCLWMLTGEGHGPGERLTPERPLPEGPGAIELGVRYEHNRMWGAVHGSTHAATVGINWYLQQHVKVPLNVVQTWLDGESETLLLLRWQVEG